MAWIGIITNNGNDLLTRWVEGKTLTVTRAAAGQGRVDPAAMLAQAALVNEKQAASIISNTPVDKGQRLKLQVTPQSEAGYSLNQFGVWARLEDEDEKMIALFQTDTDIGVEIPSKADMPDFVYTFYGLLAFSNQGTLHITVDPSTMVTLDTMNAAIGAAVATREESIKNAEKKNDLADGDSVAIVDSADSSKTKRVLWSTIKSALSKIYVPLTRKINSKSLSSDVTLTGADIQVSRTDNTKIDAALSNKAPGGYGLGTAATNIPDLNDATKNGWYMNGAGGEAVHAPDNVPGWLVLVCAYADEIVFQTAYRYGSDEGLISARRSHHYLFGGWQPWEWITPQMVPGIEYRTVKRDHGKVVYEKTVQTGALPAGGTKSIAHGVSDIGLRLTIRCAFDNDGNNLVGNPGIAGILVDQDNIIITTTAEYGTSYGDGTSNSWVSIAYTKNTISGASNI